MAHKRIVAFLIKIGPVFLALLWLWHSVGAARVYHEVLAAFLTLVYPGLDPAGVVQGVGVKEHELMLRLLVGKTKSALAINANDITSDMALLAALYLSSPIRRHWRRFAAYFPAALVVLFLLHALTIVSFSQEAFIGNPAIARLGGYTQRHADFLVHYNVFFEQMGMYMFPLVLWFPYILSTLNDR
jgi:hypothetical protein